MRTDAPAFETEIDGRVYTDFLALAVWYCERVLDGDRSAPFLIRQGCKRFLERLEEAEKGAVNYVASPRHLIDLCAFLEHLPLVEEEEPEDDDWTRLVLQPWQAFALAGIYLFRRKSNGSKVTRHASLWIPRGNGKSKVFGAGLALANLTFEGGRTPDIFIAGPTEAQAKKVFTPAKAIVDADEDLRTEFGLSAFEKIIRCERSAGKMQTITSKGKHQDGHNPTFVGLEEVHAQDADLYGVMRSSMGKRADQLMVEISTAGRDATGHGYDQFKASERLLTGAYKNPLMFALMYAPTGEEVERPVTEETLIEMNPNWGVSLDPATILAEIEEAKQKPSSAAELKRTRMNIWARGASNLISPEAWDRAARPLRRSYFRGERALVACDLASVNDLASVGIMFERDGEVFGFQKSFICEDAPAFSRDGVAADYQAWREEGLLHVNSGGMIDYGPIVEHIEFLCEEHEVDLIGFDQYQANTIAQDLQEKGLPVCIVKKTTLEYSHPSDELLARIGAPVPTFIHNGDPVMRFAAMNVSGHYDHNGNVLPKKPKPNSHRKIDPMEVMFMANVLRIARPEPERKVSVYETRGLLGAEEDRA